MIRCKMVCSSVTKSGTEPNRVERVRLDAVSGGSAENAAWSRFTPSGSLEFSITNLPAQGKIEPGAEYFIDITPAPAVQK